MWPVLEKPMRAPVISTRRSAPLALLCAVLSLSCADGGTDGTSDTTTDSDAAAAAADFLGAFDADGLVAPITEEACTLSSGVETTCWRVEFQGAPSDHEVGPFCPRSIDDGPESAGIWIESGDVYDVDGAFIVGLADFYNDPEWQLYDEVTGLVNVTDSEASCSAAARPDVDPQYNNYCVECSLDYVDGGIATTVLIPKVPVPIDTPLEIRGAALVGVALNGVAFDPPAPVQAILGAHTIAAFDDCGGHVNLIAGYHYHAATGCSKEVASDDGHAARIGYALDGYAITARVNEDGEEPADLDECRGHTDAVRGYHYHVAYAGENLFVGCFHGDIAASEAGGAGPGGGGGGGGQPPVADCAPGQTSMCCGDGVCDGPETADNCAADCG
jgi:hypothetical protein